jgi:hypothetical protein
MKAALALSLILDVSPSSAAQRGKICLELGHGEHLGYTAASCVKVNNLTARLQGWRCTFPPDKLNKYSSTVSCSKETDGCFTCALIDT